MDEKNLSGDVIGAAIEVHRVLGPGLLESAYELALEYKGIALGDGFRIDLLVEELLIVEVKAVDGLLPIHEAQLLTYLRLSGKRVGLLINFNERTLKEGIKRVMNGY